MNEDRLAGATRNIGGKLEEGFGRMTGDGGAQLQDKVDQVAGAAQDLYGQGSEAAQTTAVTLDKWIRTIIESQPYAAAAAALGIGWLIGRLHRPL
jgi:uncharacterized protein YjbJ (UPF0337 family)